MMAGLVIITGTDPTSRRGGIGFAMPGYLRALDKAGIRWVSIPTYHPQIWGGKWRLWVAAFSRLVRVILLARRSGMRVVVYSHAGAGVSLLREFFVLLCARGLGAGALMQLHAPEVNEYFQHRLKRRLFFLAVAPAHALGVLTPWWKRRLEGAGIRSKPLHVIPNPMPEEWETRAGRPRRVRAAADRLVLLSLTRFVRGKGVEQVVEAMPYLPRECELILAGDGPMRAALARRVAELGIDGRVRFTGWVMGEEKQHLFDEADVFVLPSRRDSFGMGYLEAMANGLPVVAAEWGPIPDVVPHGRCGVLVRGEKPEDLAAAILALRDADTRRRMGQAGKRWVMEKFSARAVGDQLACVLGALAR